jgi:hypothetical protein
VTAVRTRRRIAVAALAVVALALTACTPLKTGSAAIVGDDTLRENDLSSLATEITELAADKEVELPDPSQLNQRIIAVWVDEQLTTALADELEVSATQANVDDLLAQFSDEQLTQIAVGSGIAPSALQDAARAAVLRQAISQSVAPDAKTQDEQLAALSKAYLDTAARLGVSVNPRYATWNTRTAQVEARTDGLSQLAEPVATPETTLPSGG